MRNSTAEEIYRDVCELQRELRDEQPMAQEVSAGQPTPQLPSGLAPEEELQKLGDFDARTQALIGEAAYAQLPICPAVQGLLWTDCFSRLDVLHDALEARRQELLGAAP